MQTKNVLKSFKDAFRDNYSCFSPEIQGRSEIESHFESSAPITQQALEATSLSKGFQISDILDCSWTRHSRRADSLSNFSPNKAADKNILKGLCLSTCLRPRLSTK